jgi:hypothetical protein
MCGCKYSFILHSHRHHKCLCRIIGRAVQATSCLTTGPVRVADRPGIQPAVLSSANDERCPGGELSGRLAEGGKVRRDCPQRRGAAANARRDLFRAVGRRQPASGSRRRPHAGRYSPHHRVSGRGSRATGNSGLLDPRPACYQDGPHCRKQAAEIPPRILAVHGPDYGASALWGKLYPLRQRTVAV